MTITLRETKGSELTFGELDGNFADLDIRTKQGWRDNVIEMTTRNGPTEPQMSIFRNGIYLLAFNQFDNMEVFGNFHIDHDYAMGTSLYPHIHWTVNSDLVGTVRWGFEYTIAKGHQQMPFSNTVIVYVEQTTTGVPYMHYVAEVSDDDAISGVGLEPDTMILTRVFRDALHPNDTYDDQVFGICLDLHYQVAQQASPNKRPNFFGE